MSKTLRKLSLVLGLVVVASMAQAVEPKPGEIDPGDPVLLEQGCCWKRTDFGVACGAPVLKKNCPDNWVANKNCGTRDCGMTLP